jgi:CBS domain-containing protein
LLVLFNMVPAFPMDGGRVLRALLALRMEYARATRIAATLGQGIALVFAAIGLFGLLGGGGNPLLLFIAFFVWIGASQEAGAVQFRSAVGGARVGDAMVTDFERLNPGESLGRAVDLVLSGSQDDFPVVEGRRVVGILTRQRLLSGLAEFGKGHPISAAMERAFRTVDRDELLEEVMVADPGHTSRVVPVLSRGELVGLLTWANITDYILIRNALRVAPSAGVGLPPILHGRASAR